MDDFLPSWFQDKRLSCHNVTEKKKQHQRLPWVCTKACGPTCMIENSLICIHFFCFLSEHRVTSRWGGQAGGHGLLDVIRLISPILTVNLMAKEQILLLLCSCQTSFQVTQIHLHFYSHLCQFKKLNTNVGRASSALILVPPQVGARKPRCPDSTTSSSFSRQT